ncbi:efflux RND transporter permease subunit [Thalassotalea hakodatensis]|uniref:efflux RND transporter permease subunit n=1 Tax=Thalassotalea hakodatensis TaxID=3030492 RepID=UPI00257447EB|nr:efflux RND transporter permease subunit [Thalassotalea hakodatensis]
MRLPKVAINNKQFTLTIVLLLVLVGTISYFTIPRSEDPQFDIPITLIEVIYPGASPHDIETLVVNPLEEAFNNIEGIKTIESQIKSDGARVKVTFLYGTNIDLAFSELKLAVASVKPNLPAGVQDVLVIKATPTSVAVVQMALWSEPTDYKAMEFYAKQLEKRLEAISAIKKADIWGYPQQIVAVDVNVAKLQHFGLGVNDVLNTLNKRAMNITPGFIDANTRRFNVKSSGNYKDLAQLNDTVILANEHTAIKLSDIARVSFSGVKPSYLAYFNEHPVIFITAEQRADTNIFELTKAIEQQVVDFKGLLPENIKLDVFFKQAESVETRVNGFFDNLWYGLVLVGVMALLFLGLREALVVIAVIPLSFLIAIGWLDFAGFGLQQMSIVGLIIALGLLVDNAIVVTESIHRHKDPSKPMQIAAAQGASTVGWAISSGTITTLFAFLPMLMLASSTGDFLRSMPITVVLVLLASLLLALTFTPLLASLLFSQKPSKIITLQVVINRFSSTVYAKVLTWFITKKTLLISVFVIALIAMFSLFNNVGLSLFPKAEKPMILVDVQAPPNSSLAYTKKVMDKVTVLLKQQPGVSHVAQNIGNSNPRIYYNEIPKRGVASFGQALVLLDEYNANDAQALIDKLRKEFSSWSQAQITVKEFTQGPVTDQPVTIRLMSESFDDLSQVADDLAMYMATLDGLINIENPIGVANTELALSVDYEKAGMLNIDIQGLDLTIQTLVTGNTAGVFSDANGESYPLVIRGDKQDISLFEQAFISTREGALVPLNQIVNVSLQKGHTEFYHYQKQRMAKVSADVATGKSTAVLTQQVVDYIEQYNLPAGMYYSLGGEEESRQENFAGLFQIMIITAIGIFAVLVLQFKSFLQPLIIFTSIPFAMAGSVIGLYLFDLSFSMMAFIGLISLFGIVVNNAIILIDTANKNLTQNADKQTAIIEAAVVRFTPILLTTITTVGGLLPLTLFGGGLWQPLGVVLISGLCVSAIASFLLVPILTEIFTRSSPQLRIE